MENALAAEQAKQALINGYITMKYVKKNFQNKHNMMIMNHKSKITQFYYVFRSCYGVPMSVQDLSTKVYRSVTTVVLVSTHRTDQRYSVNICY